MDIYGDWSVVQPYEEEQDVPELVTDQQEAAQTIPPDYPEEKVKLYKKIKDMTARERELFIKIIQYDAIVQTLEAIKNLKKTTAEEWKRIISKLNSLKDIKISPELNKIIKTITPLVAALAGMLLAMREAEKKESLAAEPENNPLDDPLFEKEAKSLFDSSFGSVILKMCSQKINGFSN